ncbi:quaternary amine ABC transporter ATP-binding protein [Methylobrevis albus]|uniref:Quaternary amine transport ATP-binding protein n=1 Tax=Methylobrevis albus TaxID=2793297 RepID=A0A931MXL6_9HYPH|nr:glycine betaine/L-proline ABC transporter ATP-binding protein [Methylobrevis albus]MBH0237322.1 glycine betaine/L-proline ABC transporter ATP-binding protein [Methylobrevis albus]
MADPSTKLGADIRLMGVYKIFGPRPADFVEAVHRGMGKMELLKHNHVLGLRDISLDIPAGAIQVIMGLSGSGKSTLIRHINRLIEPSSGAVLVDGVDVCAMNPDALRDFRRKQTAMVFQKFGLLPHWSVLDNTMFGLKIRGTPVAQARDTAMRWIERVGLKGYETKYPNQLSGGMQQRVGLARALANDAPILLMDEAFSALDPLIRVDMQTVLLDLQKEVRKTIVFITHDLDEALRLGDRVAILRDGEVVQKGTAQDIVLRPADDYIASFVKEVNRGRVIVTASVMHPIGSPGTARPDGLPEVPGEVPLETAAKIMTEAGTMDAVVLGPDGRAAGILSMRDVITAMVTPVGHTAAPPRPAPALVHAAAG